MADQITASGDRSVAVGTVINSIVNTGDHNRFFIGDYERLRDAYIEPWPVFERVNLARFVGREWLLAEVDTFLRDHDRGYLVLEAKAGLGKTTFLAWLVKQRGYVHHFVELARGQEGVGIGLKNLGAQLVLNYHLEAWEAEGVLPGSAVRPDYLARLLKLAADQRQDGEKVVLVVDALDEAGTPMGQNVLGLPQVLPEGVYVIASQRPVAVTLQVDTASTARRVFRLAAGSGENQADMRRYLEGAVTWPGITEALRDSGYSAAQFVATLAAKCRGVWIYLHYVIHEIERGERSPLDLDGLPDGMTQYYARYWRSWRDANEEIWYESYLPLLATLAAAREAVSARRLQEWTGVTLAQPRLNKLLSERWRPFLGVTDVEGEMCFRFYHATLTEFFAGQVERAKLSEAEAAMTNELAEATRAAHGLLADRYLEAWGGLANELPGLQDASMRDTNDGYGLRHLGWHLAGAGRWEELHALVAEGKGGAQPWAEAKLRADGHYGGYVIDVELAWQDVHQRIEEAVDEDAQTAALARGWRYALIVTSINSLAGNYEPLLVGRAVETGQWSVARALMVAARVPGPERRAAMYSAILGAPTLARDVRLDAANGALKAVSAIRSEQARAKMLGTLVFQLPDEQLSQLLAIAEAIPDERTRVDALAMVIPHLSDGLCRQAQVQALAATSAIRDEETRASSLAALISLLTVDQMVDALTIANAIESEWARLKALEALVPRLSEEHLEAGLAAAAHMTVGSYRARILEALAPRVAGDLAARMLAVAMTLDDQGLRARALQALAPQLPDELLGEGLTAASAISNEMYRANVVAALAPRLTSTLMPKAVTLAQAMQSDFRAWMLSTLAVQLSGTQQTRVLAQAVDAARAIRDEGDRVWELTNLCYQLDDETREEVLADALAAARSIPQEQDRASALVMVAEQLPDDLRGEVLCQAVAAITGIADAWTRGTGLLVLARQMPDGLRQELAVTEGLEILIAQLTDNSQARTATSQYSEREGACAQSLAALAPQLADVNLPRALMLVQALNAEWPQVQALTALAPRLSGDLTGQGLEVALAISDEWLRAQTLSVMVPGLTGALIGRAFTGVQSIGDERAWAKVLAELAPYLTGDLQAQALSAALSMSDEEARRQVLSTLVPNLTDDLLAQGLGMGQAIQDSLARADALGALVPSLTGERRKQAIMYLWLTANDQADDWRRAEALAILAPHLAGDLLEQTLVIAKAIEDVGARTWLEAALAPYLPFDRQQEAIAHVMKMIQTLKRKQDRGFVLVAVAPQLTGDLLEQGLEMAWLMWNDRRSAQALIALAPQLDPETREEVVESVLTACECSTDVLRAGILTLLAPVLDGERLTQGLSVAGGISDEWHRSQALVALAPKTTRELAEQVLAMAAAIQHHRGQAMLLVALVPQLTGESKQQATVEAMTAIEAIGNERQRAQVLATLAPELNGEFLLRALGSARAIRFGTARAMILRALAASFSGTEKQKIDHEIRVAIRDQLWSNAQRQARAAVLGICTQNVFSASQATEPLVADQIARAVFDVGQWWP